MHILYRGEAHHVFFLFITASPIHTHSHNINVIYPYPLWYDLFTYLQAKITHFMSN